MSYIDKNLIPGEHLLFRTSLHWKLYLPTLAVFLCSVLVIIIAFQRDLSLSRWLLIFLLPLGTFLNAFITRRCSEFAVTDKRVLIKTGIIARHTLETLLTKVENIGVEQTFLGRILNYGTINVTGAGGTKEIFAGIHRPMAFRKALESAAVAFEERRPTSRWVTE